MQTTVRLANLQVFNEQSLVSDYRLTYAQGTSTGRSQLTSVTLCGAGNTCLPATSFTWQQGNANGASSFTKIRHSDDDSYNLFEAPPVVAGDWNGDGLADLYMSPGVIIDGEPTFTRYITENVQGRMILGDWNGDGLIDGFKGGYHYYDVWMNNGAQPDLITKFRSGFGATTSITYKPLNGTGVYHQGQRSECSGCSDAGPGSIALGGLACRSVRRHWGPARLGLQLCRCQAGSAGTRLSRLPAADGKDLRSGIATTSSYRQDYPFAGLVAGENSTLAQLTLSAITNSYGAANLGGTRRRAFLSGSVATRTDLDGTALPSVTSTYQYDAFGNATQITAATSDGFSKTTTNSYSNDEINWLLGRLTRATAVSQTP